MFSRTLFARTALLGLAALVIPACGTNDEADPLALKIVTPAPGSNNPRQLNIIMRFDRALDPASVVAGNFALIDSLSNPITLSAPVYNSVLNTVTMTPTGALGVNLTGGGTTKTYQMNVGTALKDSMGVNFAGAAWQFNVPASDDDTRPSFGGLSTAAAASPTSIDLTWTILALNDADGHPIVYDVYMSTLSQGQDFQAAPLVSGVAGPVGSFTTTITTLAPLTPYYFVVRARDTTTGDTDANTTERSATPM